MTSYEVVNRLIEAARAQDLAPGQKTLAWALLALLDAKVDVNDYGFTEYTPLTLVAMSEEAVAVKVVGALLAVGVEVDKACKTVCRTPLFFAAWGGKLEVAKVLLASGAVVDHRDYIGQTPLMLAARTGHAEMVDLLIASGADVNAGSYTGSVLYSAACSHDSNIEVLKSLLRAGADASWINQPVAQDKIQNEEFRELLIEHQRMQESIQAAEGVWCDTSSESIASDSVASQSAAERPQGITGLKFNSFFQWIPEEVKDKIVALVPVPLRTPGNKS